jgi:hypothetical protein
MIPALVSSLAIARFIVMQISGGFSFTRFGFHLLYIWPCHLVFQHGIKAAVDGGSYGSYGIDLTLEICSFLSKDVIILQPLNIAIAQDGMLKLHGYSCD